MKYTYILSALVGSAIAHTWVEQLNVIAPNGTMIGQPGFPRGNVKRGTPGFSDPTMVNLIPPDARPINQIFNTDLMCKDTQTKQQQGEGDRLKATPGANVALRYQENGHVTLPQNQPGKPNNRGTVFVYGTTQPREDDKFLSIHRVWNANGTGGDKRGVLLSTQNFDDNQCYQVNGGQISTTRQKTFAHTANQLMGADLWCQQDIQIPTTAPSGKPYTLYWVWDWPTMPGTAGFPEGKQEIYTTCMDVDIVAGANVQQKVNAVNFIKQDFANAAVSAQLADIANPTAVTGQSIPFSAASGTASSTDSSGKQPPSAAPSPSSSIAPQPQVPASPPIMTALSQTSAPSIISSITTSLDSSSQITGLTSFASETAAADTTAATAPSVTSDSGRNGHPGFHSGHPNVSPVGPTSAPFPQPTHSQGFPGTNPGNRESNHPNSGNNPQKTGTATTSNAAALTTTTVVGTGAVLTVTDISTAYQTVVQTQFETVYQSKRSKVATAAPVVANELPPIRNPGSSTTESVYRLRARNPFFHP